MMRKGSAIIEKRKIGTWEIYLTHKLSYEDGRYYEFTKDNFYMTLSELLSQECHIYIYGVGGMGKSEFLRNIKSVCSTYRVHLVNLNYLQYREEDIYPPLAGNDENSSAIYQQIKRTYSISYQEFLEDLNDEKTILLLDGINEVGYRSRDPFLKELRLILNKSCKVWITGRTVKECPSVMKWTGCPCLELTSNDNRIKTLRKIIGPKHNPYLCQLVNAPMYYHILWPLAQKKNCDFSKYTNKFSVISELIECTHAHLRDRITDRKEQQLSELTIRMVFPWLAYRMAKMSNLRLAEEYIRYEFSDFIKTINEITLEDFVREYSVLDYSYEAYKSIFEYVKRIDPFGLMASFKDFMELIQPGWQDYMHQDFRDYGAAVFYKKRMDLLASGLGDEDTFNKMELSTDVVLDSVDESTSDFILSAVLMPQDEKKTSYYEAFYTYYNCHERFIVQPHSYAGFLKWGEISLQLGEALSRGLKANEKMPQIYRETMGKFLRKISAESIVQRELTLDERLRLSKILLKGAELYRRNNQFDFAASALRLEKENVERIDDTQAQTRRGVMQKHHEAKLVLSRYQAGCEERLIESSECNLDAAKDGLIALEHCATVEHYLYSAVSLGFFYSYPSPAILRVIGQADYPRAFWYYYSEAFGHDPDTRQIRAYPIRNCISLLLHGLVHVNTTSEIDFNQLKRAHLVQGAHPGKPEDIDVEIANHLLNMLNNTRAPLKFVYRGLIKAHYGEWSEALYNFSWECEERLAQVAVYRMYREKRITKAQLCQYGFNGDRLREQIKQQLCNLQSELGKPCKIDDWYPQHLLNQIYWVDSYWKEYMAKKEL